MEDRTRLVYLTEESFVKTFPEIFGVEVEHEGEIFGDIYGLLSVTKNGVTYKSVVCEKTLKKYQPPAVI